ncbi:MAG: glycosyltransferase [Bacteroidia bacterium]|nr:glycosyltransferase [Bacteroidia bacterium]
MIWEEIVFWSLAGALAHSYLVFPLAVRLLAHYKKTAVLPEKPLPTVSVLVAAYNEASVICEKLQSVLDQDYPSEKIEILVGSDASTDSTNEQVEALSRRDARIQLKIFPQRTGKIGIINDLAALSTREILVITDANVLFEKSTLKEMLRHYADDRTGLVDTNMMHRDVGNRGIAKQEHTYIRTEVGTKNAEGKLWGCMMGPFGGCYSVRRELFSPVPPRFLVDDFYVNMKVLQKGYKCINEKNAMVFEDVSYSLKEEFRRKIRIATGNFQNMFRFSGMLFRFDAVSFCFFSHKILRWLGPWLMLVMLFQNIYLLQVLCECTSAVYRYTLWAGAGILALPLLDLACSMVGLNIKIFRFATHFLSMNLALFIGTFRFLRGVRTSVWQPTRRHQ